MTSNLAPTACPCERRFQEAIAELKDKAKRYPEMFVPFTQTSNEVRKIQISHFFACNVCRGEDAAARSEAE